MLRLGEEPGDQSWSNLAIVSAGKCHVAAVPDSSRMGSFGFGGTGGFASGGNPYLRANMRRTSRISIVLLPLFAPSTLTESCAKPNSRVAGLRASSVDTRMRQRQ